MGDVYAAFLLGALALILVWAGIEDARTREIANWKTGAVAALAPLWWVANGVPLWPEVAIQLGLAVLILTVFAGAFAIGQMGGGDVKLIAALALWLPPLALLWMVVLMSVVGFALTLLMLGDQWVRNRASLPPFPWRQAALALAAVAGAVLLVRSGAIDLSFVAWLQTQPILWTAAVMLLFGLAAIPLLLGARWARRKGLIPETPYGVAIAIAALLTLREPILNQFG